MQLGLFGWVEETLRPRRPKVVRPASAGRKHQLGPVRPTPAGWAVSDHACRHCVGRVLTSTNAEGLPIARCAQCGATSNGEHDALCWCGQEMPGHGRVFECVRNPDASLTDPHEIIVRERPLKAVP